MNKEELLKKEKKELQRKSAMLKGVRRALIISEFTLPTILTTALTLGGAKLLFGASPLRENDKASYEVTTEEFDNSGAIYRTKETNPYVIKETITVDYYQPWIKNGNAYYRNVTTYQLENNDEIANILKKTIDDLTEDDLRALKFVKVDEYQQEGVNLTAEDLNQNSYIKVNNEYISNIIYSKETIAHNIGEIIPMLIIGGFLLFVEYGYNAFLCSVIDADPKKNRITDKLEFEYSNIDSKINEIEYTLNNRRKNKKIDI